eukprot:TRINITY_DN8341_c0_g1_i1.p1 TRINITY_DN8341_c0_g1~~TRINITY_DN8341_c0_g1_i1.p1  ORF type:complete len:184 (+),score=37.44 TRINITY_DN8341_c0_g1_i1:35-553(+)
MGSPCSIVIVVRGKRIRVYRHHDGYPDCAGVMLLQQLQHLLQQHSMSELMEKFLALQQHDPEELVPVELHQKLWKYREDLGHKEEWYQMLRRCQGDLLMYLEAGHVPDIGEDGCGAYYDYIIDLDAGLFTVRRGATKLDGAVLVEYPLNALPSDPTVFLNAVAQACEADDTD